MRDSRKWLIASALLLGTGRPVGAQSAAEQDLLRFVEAAHQSSRDQIRTVYCRVQFTITAHNVGRPPATNTQKCTGEYWHSADAVRLKATDGGEVTEYVWKNSVRDGLIWRGGVAKEVSAFRGGYSYRYMHRADAWVRGLLAVNVPETGHSIPFEQLRAKASKVVKVERRPVGGVDLIAVRLRFDKSETRDSSWEVEVLFDPTVNYLVRKVVHSEVGRKFKRIEEVTRFKDCGQGIFFPERATGNAGSDDPPNGTPNETVLSDIRVNVPLPADTFRIKFPNGVYLTDSIRGTYYRVDPDGKPMSAEKELGKTPPPSAARMADPEETAESVEEPRSWSRWILPGAAALLLAGLGLAYYRRRRQNRAELGSGGASG